MDEIVGLQKFGFCWIIYRHFILRGGLSKGIVVNAVTM
jgi:hypothetical protein